MKIESKGILNILGTEYALCIKKYDEDEEFKRLGCGGYCAWLEHQIVICDMHTYPGWENETEQSLAIQQKQTLRHEIVHAFLNESGLADNSNGVDAWARNEEMVDWFALQGPKIYKIWREVGALE